MQGNLGEIFEPVNHVWEKVNEEEEKEGKAANQKIFPRKSIRFGVDERNIEKRGFKFNSSGLRNESENRMSESGKSKENLLYSPSIQSKTWVFNTPCTKPKEKKPAPDLESNYKKLLKTQYATPLPNISHKTKNSQVFSSKFNLLLNSESIEAESFQRNEQKKAVELLKRLKDESLKTKVLETEQNLKDLQELETKCFELREKQIGLLNQIMDYELPNLQELPSIILRFAKSIS